MVTFQSTSLHFERLHSPSTTLAIDTCPASFLRSVAPGLSCPKLLPLAGQAAVLAHWWPCKLSASLRLDSKELLTRSTKCEC